MAVNLLFFHTVMCTSQCGNYGNSLSRIFGKNSVKVTVLLIYLCIPIAKYTYHLIRWKNKFLKSWFDEKKYLVREKCGNYGNLLSLFFGKNFVKVTFSRFLLKKLLNKWFDKLFLGESRYHWQFSKCAFTLFWQKIRESIAKLISKELIWRKKISVRVNFPFFHTQVKKWFGEIFRENDSQFFLFYYRANIPWNRKLSTKRFAVNWIHEIII